VRIRPAAAVNVKLEGYAKGRPVSPLLVAVKLQGEADRQFHYRGFEVDEDGEKWVGPVQSGAAEILVGVQVEPRKSHLFWTVARVPIKLKPGNNDVAIPMPKLHPVTVKGKSETRFRISPVGQWQEVYIEYVVIGRTGEVVIPQLARGAYEISGSTNGKSWKIPVAVPRTAVVQLP